MGTLLAASVGADKLRPVLGMAVFASGLVAPFFFLALFPQFLKKLPRSGEWLSRVKVVMGFLVLAFMLKHLYSLDAVLQTGLPDARTFSRGGGGPGRDGRFVFAGIRALAGCLAGDGTGSGQAC